MTRLLSARLTFLGDIILLCCKHRMLQFHVLTANELRTDATAGITTQQKDAATNLIWPLFADRVITTEEWVDSVSMNGTT